jgi:hypothetical protein
MENASKDIITVLKYLLPGFLAAWVYYGFTSFRKPAQFERVIQAFIFTFIVQISVDVEKSTALLFGKYVSFGALTGNVDNLFSFVTAVFAGLIFAFFVNTDKFHATMRKIGVTKETSYPSEWFGAFNEHPTWVVLHLEDERRLYGWPADWASEPDKGHIVLMQASWLTQDWRGNPIEIQLDGVEAIMVSAKDVKRVEFIKVPEQQGEPSNGKEGDKSAAAADV